MALPVVITFNDNDYYAYGSVEEADKYLSAKYGSTWSAKDEETKKQLLISATRLIDTYTYAGSRLEDTQPLEFPRQFRDGSLSDDNLVKSCCFEVADSLGTSGSTSGVDSSVLSGIKSYKVGDVDVTFKDDATIEVSSQEDIIKAFLGRYMTDVGGAKIWL